MLGSSLNTTSYTVVCVLFLRFVLPGKWLVCCIGSNVKSLCGVVRFATCLTCRVESSIFSVNFVIVGFRVVCVTVDISSILWVAFNLLFVRHSVHLSFIRIFQTVRLQFPFKMCHNLFIRVVLQVGLVYWFLQVWRHFGIYELVNDCLGSNSERIFCQFLEFVQKSINFWFTGLNTSCWNLCFAVAIDWGFTYFLRNTVRISARFSRFGLLMFLNVCSAPPRMREWK